MNPRQFLRALKHLAGDVIPWQLVATVRGRDCDAAVLAAADQLADAEAEYETLEPPQCPLGGACIECDRTPSGCVQTWGPDSDYLEAARRNAAHTPVPPATGPICAKCCAPLGEIACSSEVVEGSFCSARCVSVAEVWAALRDAPILPVEVEPHPPVAPSAGLNLIDLITEVLTDHGISYGECLAPVIAEALEASLAERLAPPHPPEGTP